MESKIIGHDIGAKLLDSSRNILETAIFNPTKADIPLEAST